MSEEIQQLAIRKNNLYRNYYRRTLKLLILNLLIAIGLGLLLGYNLLTLPKAKYFATTTTGRVVPMYPLSVPIYTQQYIREWASIATRRAYNLDFVHYNKQLQKASGYFSGDGWQTFLQAIKPNIELITQNKLFMSAVVDGPVVIAGFYYYHGRYTWLVQVPLLVTYTSASEKQKKHYIVSMTIRRMPVIDINKGIAIVSFKAS